MKLSRCIVELERLYGIYNGNHRNKDVNNPLPKSQPELANEIGISIDQYKGYKKLLNLIPNSRGIWYNPKYAHIVPRGRQVTVSSQTYIHSRIRACRYARATDIVSSLFTSTHAYAHVGTRRVITKIHYPFGMKNEWVVFHNPHTKKALRIAPEGLPWLKTFILRKDKILSHISIKKARKKEPCPVFTAPKSSDYFD